MRDDCNYMDVDATAESIISTLVILVQLYKK